MLFVFAGREYQNTPELGTGAMGASRHSPCLVAGGMVVDGEEGVAIGLASRVGVAVSSAASTAAGEKRVVACVVVADV